MNFPLGFTDLSKLIALLSIILIITSVIVNQSYRNSNLSLDKRHLERFALILGLLSLISIALIIFEIIIYK